MSTPYTVSREVLEHQRRAVVTTNRLTDLLGRDPTDEELAEATDLTSAQIADVRAIPKCVDNLHHVFETGVQLLDLECPTDGGLDQWETRQWLEKELADLPAREAEVLRLWAGWNGDEMTVADIARRIGVSVQWAHEIKKRALQHLQERILAHQDG